MDVVSSNRIPIQPSVVDQSHKEIHKETNKGTFEDTYHGSSVLPT